MEMPRPLYRNLSESIDTHPIEAPFQPYIRHGSSVFTMGSCFAWTLQSHFRRRGFDALTVSTSEHEPDLIWYNTYTMRYEFERVTGEFVQDPADCWHPKPGFQDPYRRLVFAPTHEELLQKIASLNARVRDWILRADLFFLTLGLTEVFFQANGRAVCAAPGYCLGGGEETQLRCTSYEENLQNVERIVEIIGQVNPSAKVILAVSPVPMLSTWTALDHLLADTESKSILRAVAGAVARRYPERCEYFHCHEMSKCFPRERVYAADGRHVSEAFAAEVMDEFMRLFVVAPQ